MLTLRHVTLRHVRVENTHNLAFNIKNTPLSTIEAPMIQNITTRHKTRKSPVISPEQVCQLTSKQKGVSRCAAQQQQTCTKDNRPTSVYTLSEPAHCNMTQQITCQNDASRKTCKNEHRSQNINQQALVCT